MNEDVHAALFPQHLLERFAEGVGPDLVAFGGGVEEVVAHDVFGEGAVGIEEFVVDVEVVDGFAVVEFGDEGVDGFVLDAGGILGGGVAGEDGQEEDFGVGGFLLHEVDDGFDAGGGFGGGVAADVVGADHQDDDFGVDVVEFAMGEAVEDVLGFVATDAEVGGFEGSEFIDPDDFAFVVEVIGDGVAFEVDVDIALFGEGEEFFVAGHPAGVGFVEAATGDGLVGGFAGGGFFGGGSGSGGRSGGRFGGLEAAGGGEGGGEEEGGEFGGVWGHEISWKRLGV
jgi:hypothetical protein